MKNNRIKLDELFFSKTWDYLNEYMPKRLSRSPDTIESYTDSLTIFRHFITDKHGRSLKSFKFNECTRDCIFEFRDYLKEKGNAPSTINLRVAAVRSYLAYAADDNISLQSLVLQISSIPPLKVPKKEKEIVSDDAFGAMLAATPDSRIGVRDLTFMTLLYDSAVRLNELLSLKLKDLNLDGEYPCILLHGKGNKERRAVIDKKTAEHIHNYMSIFHKDPSPDDYLFYTTIKGIAGKMSHGNGERILNKYAEKARDAGFELPDTIYPHMLRRKKATALYQNGVPLEMISTLLGHSQIQTTKIYARPSMKQMQDAMSKVESPTADEKPLWLDDEDILARLAGLR